MMTEHGQMLCSAVQALAPEFAAKHNLWKSAYLNHPCTIWTRASKANFMELIERTYALHREYLRRGYNRHKFMGLLPQCRKAAEVIDWGDCLNSTPYARCFNKQSGITPDKSLSAVNQYRQYILTKSYTQPYDPAVHYLALITNVEQLANPELRELWLAECNTFSSVH